MTVQVHDGLFNRVIGLFDLVARIPDDLSDAETTGLLKLLPPETASNMSAFFAPRTRRAGISFLKTLAKWMNQARRAKAEGKKIILVPFNFPPELVICFDNAVPLTSEVLTTMAAVALEGGGERYWDVCMSLGLPDHICSSNSIEAGSVLSGKDLLPDAIISAAPGGCDANAKVHEFMSHYLDIPQFVLEKPVDDSPEGHRQYEIYFRQLIGRLEEFVGEKLTEEKMRRVLTKANRCTELYWDIYELKKAAPSPVPNLYSVFLAPLRFCMWGEDEAIRTLEIMAEEGRKRLAAGAYPGQTERARTLWAYTSYYFDLLGLHNWMEDRGYTHLLDALDLYMPQPVDLTDYDSMVRGMIGAAWDYPMNRQMAAESMSRAWVEDMIHNARELNADCVIYCGHDACKQTWSVVSILREELMKRAGLPTLILHGDSWMKTTTPMSALQREIDEFIESTVIGQGDTKKTVRRRKIKRRVPVTPIQ